MIKILHNLALFRVKTLIFFGKNIFKILASVAGANPTTSELQLKRRRCSRQERFFHKVEENIFVFKTHWATRGVVNFYSAAVATHDIRIGSMGPC
jgi:hypothetical protein